MSSSFDNNVFVSGMILRVSKTGWVRVLLDKLCFLLFLPVLQVSFSSHWHYLGSRVCRALDCLLMNGFYS